jgi:Na+-driven multidrug efflux pump
MFSNLRRNTIIVGALSLLFCFSMAIAPVRATSLLDSQVGMDQVSQSYGGTDRNDVKDIRSIIAQVINVASTLLGTIFVITIIIAGFLYMTAAGDEKKVEKAMSYIKAGVIGLVIVLMAWSLTNFVFNGRGQGKGALIQATGAR